MMTSKDPIQVDGMALRFSSETSLHVRIPMGPEVELLLESTGADTAEVLMDEGALLQLERELGKDRKQIGAAIARISGGRYSDVTLTSD